MPLPLELRNGVVVRGLKRHSVNNFDSFSEVFFYLFIYGEFNDAVGSSGYIAFDGRMINDR
jgi:hypothetical protein